MSLTILVAPSGFKESLSAEEAANCIEKGVLRACPSAEVLKVPWSTAVKASPRRSSLSPAAACTN
jgi:hypothetical protein